MLKSEITQEEIPKNINKLAKKCFCLNHVKVMQQLNKLKGYLFKHERSVGKAK